MPEINRVTVQLRGPADDFPGQVTDGFYIVEDGLLTMTDEQGVMVQDEHGQSFQARVDEGANANARAIAAVLTPKVRRALRGQSEKSEAFNRKLDLPKMSVA